MLTAEGGDSYLLGYDAGGNAVSRTFYRGSQLKVQYSGYDLRGNRTVEYHEQLSGAGGYFGIDRTFSYDANSRLTGTRRYFAAGSSWTRTSRPGEIYEEYETYDFSGWLSDAENYSYDADGRLIYQESWRRKDNYEGWVPLASQYNTDNRQTYDTSVLDTLKSRVEYVDAAGNSIYDSTGKAKGFRTYAPGYMHTYTTTYEGWESYKEKTVSGVSTNSNYKPTTNTLSYDLVGRLTSL
ncbi:hypothetical protein K4L06_00930 [Lysobacter sp. BMK333-48F3]|uniref:hypothetical protein n=1 Tax=Lysobacter sp. BMK333-48F3 TaxID=2867962 RepID=UPI001C8B6674|nr:hypothetical protein [Lysobacter sp. BMK333-48F3]MBX9399857.1 hypothetical protein [Lysobacter sp. BMK333-48F3]